MTQSEIMECAKRLDAARLAKESVERLTLTHPALSAQDGYEIQAEGLMLRLGRGERQVGLKMGLTSEAKRQQMGLHSPVFGALTDKMQLQNGATLALREGIHPKVEPELAFFVGQELGGPITLEEAREGCSGVAAAMEILDSRYRDFKYFSLPDVIADNSSSFMFVVSGSWEPLGSLALEQLSLTMSVNGEPKQSALGSAISGHPLRSVVQLCELLSQQGKTLPKGSIVLAGAATVAEQLRDGDRVELCVEGLAPVLLNARMK
jgi:2-oxo-3-hexenedioate decarboxylase